MRPTVYYDINGPNVTTRHWDLAATNVTTPNKMVRVEVSFELLCVIKKALSALSAVPAGIDVLFQQWARTVFRIAKTLVQHV